MSKARSRAIRLPESSPRLAAIEREVEAWRKKALPDVAAPLDVEDVARLVRSFVDVFGAADAGESFSANTVHYYRRKDILDEPEGRTAAARYGLHHVWQAIGARLAGFLGLVTLAEARDAIRSAPDEALRRFVAERVADVRARAATREASAMSDARALPEPSHRYTLAAGASPQANTIAEQHATINAATAKVLALGGDALCLVPSGHPALHSRGAARALVAALARELGVTTK